MKAYTQKRELAILLRKQGFSLKEIVKELKIAKSTAWVWVGDVVLDEFAKEEIVKKIVNGRFNAGMTRRLERRSREELAGKLANEDSKKLPLNPLTARTLCSMLYWGEGGKTGSSVRFTNSDPKLIQSFLRFFRLGFPVKEEKFSVILHLHPYHIEADLIQYWVDITKIPVDKIHIFRKNSYGNIVREGYKGCVCINYYDVNIFLWLKQLCVYL